MSKTTAAGGVSTSMYRLGLCGGPTLWPSEWCPRAWPSARPSGPVAETSTSSVVTVMETTSASSMTETCGIVSGSGAVSRGSLRPLGSGNWLASPEEGCCRFAASWTWRRLLDGDDASLICNDSRPSSPCSTTTAATGIAAALPVRQQLQGVALGTVLSLATLLLCFGPGADPAAPECRIRALGGNLENLGRNCFNQPPVQSWLLSSVISRLEGSRGTFHPSFGLGRKGENHLDTQFCHGPSELGGRSGRPGSGRVLEDRGGRYRRGMPRRWSAPKV